MSAALEILRGEIAAGASQVDLARRVGVSKTAICLLLSGKYPGGTEKMEQKIRAALTGFACAWNGQKTTARHCAAIASSPAPSWSPAAFRQWQACQSCANKRSKPC